jgi:hypothetical protein
MIKQNGINLIVLLLILFGISCVNGQNRQDKTIAIIKKLKIAENGKYDIIDFSLKPLKYQATGNDSIRLVEIEKQLSEVYRKLVTCSNNDSLQLLQVFNS